MLPIPPNLTKEYIFSRNTHKSQIIYIATVISIFTALILLPIIKINISINAKGIIRPLTEKTEIKTLVSEKVEKINIKEGDEVIKGETIIELNCEKIDTKINYIFSETNKLKKYIHDINKFDRSGASYSCLSSLYHNEFLNFHKKLEELNNKISKAQLELTRNKDLYEKEIISRKEFNDLQFNHTLLIKEKETFLSSYKSKLQSELTKYKTELDQFNSELSGLTKERDYYTIKAPVTGSVEVFNGIYQGSSVQSGQTIAIISPKTVLIAEIYIPPQKIGYIIENNKVRIQVDAFNYNEWGYINGKVVNISDDFIIADDIPVFKIKCDMEKTYLMLKNGIRGNLKKGMTINAGFLITKKSLFQLIYQKTDNWLNPSRNTIN